MKLRQKEVLLRYIMSFVGIALILCSLIGFALLTVSVNTIEKISLEETQNKLILATNDLDTQIDIMKDIMARVKTTAYYLPVYIDMDVLNEVTLLENFVRFENFSPLFDQFYLYYMEKGEVYSKTGKYSFSVFSRYVLDDDASALQQTLNNVEDFAIIELDSHPNALYFVLANQISKSPVRMIFQIEKKVLQQRIYEISGLKPQRWILSYQDRLILGSNDDDEKPLASDTTVSGLRIDVFTNQGNQNLQIFLWRIIFIWIMITIFGIVCAFVLAKLNYRPIQKILRQFSGYQREKDEFATINSILTSAIQKEANSERRLLEIMILLRDQRELLRNRLLYMLIKGEHTADIVEELEEVGIVLDLPYFCLLLITAADSHNALYPAGEIEALSDDTIRFYGVEYKNNALLVLVNMTEYEDYQYVQDIAEAHLEDSSYMFRSSGIAETIKNIPGIMKSFSMLDSNEDQPRLGKQSIDRINESLSWLQTGNVQKTILALQSALMPLDNQFPFVTQRRGIYSQIYCMFLDAAISLNIQQDNRITAMVLSSNNAGEFLENIRPTISQAAYEATARSSKELASGENSVNDIIRYINDHISDYALTLDLLENEFQLPTWQISRMLRKKTGMSYKEYILERRLENAKYMLIESGSSVKEISKQSGYANTSYFIKTFKARTGMTPSMFRMHKS